MLIGYEVKDGKEFNPCIMIVLEIQDCLWCRCKCWIGKSYSLYLDLEKAKLIATINLLTKIKKPLLMKWLLDLI